MGEPNSEKKIKKQEEEERIRKLQEEDKLRRLQQSGGPITSMGSQPPATQSAQPLSMPTLPTPQPHPKLLENKQQVAQPLMAIKQEPQPDPNAAGLQKTQSLQPAAKGQDLHTGQVGAYHSHLSILVEVFIPVLLFNTIMSPCHALRLSHFLGLSRLCSLKLGTEAFT